MKQMCARLVAVLVVLFGTLAVGSKTAYGTSYLDSLKGGQLRFDAWYHHALAAGDSATVVVQHSYNTSFVFPLTDSVGRMINTDTVARTLYVHDSINTHITNVNMYVRILVFASDGSIDTSNFLFCVVDTVWRSPHITMGATTPTYDGAVQTYALSTGTGRTPATVWMRACPSDSVFNYGVSYAIAIDTLTANGNVNYVFHGFPPNTLCAYKFYVRNALGVDSTSARYFLSLPSYAPATVSSATTQVVGYDSLRVRHGVVTNGLSTTATFYYGVSRTSLNDSIVQTLAGTSGESDLLNTPHGLASNTLYYYKVRVANSAGVNYSPIDSSRTNVAFRIWIDTLYISGATSENVVVKCTVPFGRTANYSLFLADSADVSFAYPILAPALVSASAGLSTTTFTLPSLAAGHQYRVGVYGYDDSTAYIGPAPGRAFTFTVPAPSIIAFTSVDTVLRGASARLVWNTRNCVSRTISGGIGSMSSDTGSTMTPPLTATTTYTLTGIGVDSTTVTRAKTIVVLDTAIVHSFTTRDSILAGTRDTIRYATQYGLTKTINGVAVTGDTGYVVTAPLYATTTDTLVVYGPLGQRITRIKTTVVVDTVRIDSFTASALTASYGDSVTYSWSIANASSAYISRLGSVPLIGSRSSGRLTVTITDTLTVYGWRGSTTRRTCTITVPAVPAPVITSFSATDDTIVYHDSVIFTWACANTVSATLAPLGSVAISGSRSSGALSATTTYTLTATGIDGSTVSRVLTVTVLPLVPTVSLSATSLTVVVGNADTFHWSQRYCDSVMISSLGTFMSDSGTVITPVFTIPGTYTYVASGYNSGVTVTASVTITVVPDTSATGILSFYPTRDTVEYGDSTVLNWSTVGFATVVINPLVGTVAATGTVNTHGIYATTVYTIIGTTATGGVFTRNKTVVVKNTTAVNDVLSNVVVNVFPNPTTEMITIENENFHQEAKYSLRNVAGQIVATSVVTGKTTNFSLGNLPSGIYFLQIGTTVRKIVKE